MLIFDEVKTGITAGWSGATGHFGVQPDLVTLAKSIGGGLPIGAFGGRREVMDEITSGRGAAPRHLQRQPPRDGRRPGRCWPTSARRTPPPTPSPATGGCSTRSTPSWPRAACRPTPCSSVPRAASPTPMAPVRNYRDYKATDFDLAFASWIWGINRGILLPPGLDEQWLVSVQHTDADVRAAGRRVRRFVAALGERRSPARRGGGAPRVTGQRRGPVEPRARPPDSPRRRRPASRGRRPGGRGWPCRPRPPARRTGCRRAPGSTSTGSPYATSSSTMLAPRNQAPRIRSALDLRGWSTTPMTVSTTAA